METVPDETLRSFVNNYFGYGNLDSPYWFIGKEEGGSPTLEGNNERVKKWAEMGSPTTLDIYEYHKLLGASDYEFSRIQPTYTKLVQILLKMKGSVDDIETRREYQFHQFGRLNSDHALLELLPLPSRSTGLWLWKDQVSNALNLANRKEYWDSVMPKRSEKLKTLIAKHKPRFVLFYSTQSDYIRAWGEISGGHNWQWQSISKYMRFGTQKINDTLYIITTHPTMKGIKNTDYPTVAEYLIKMSNS